jgi:23S rRNA (uracil1939-C5)-methyltransferase
MARPRRLRLQITSLAAGGDGVAHTEVLGERRAVFVPGTAPGDEVDAEVDLAGRPARARDIHVTRASPARREPPCPHATACGGCAWMHLTPEARSTATAQLAVEAILRVLPAGTTPEIVHHPAPSELGYRTRARLAIVGGSPPIVGFHRAQARRVVGIPSCLVLHPALDPALGLLREALASTRGAGEARVALGAGGLPVIALSWKGDLPASAFAALDRMVQSARLAGASVELEGAKTPAIVGDPTIWTVGPDGLPLEAPGFSQANPAVTTAIAQHLASHFGPPETSLPGATSPARADLEIAELYAGAGTFTVLLAPLAARYVAIESDPLSVAAARRNLARRAVEGVRFVTADAAEAKLPRSTSVVVLDPPRAGAAAAIAAIAATKAQDVIYVSCDPATLARDVKKLQEAGFSLGSLHTFDMFPQTPHVESVARLVRCVRS